MKTQNREIKSSLRSDLDIKLYFDLCSTVSSDVDS